MQISYFDFPLSGEMHFLALRISDNIRILAFAEIMSKKCSVWFEYAVDGIFGCFDLSDNIEFLIKIINN